MDIRYQVFVSSTYADLREERRRVIEAVIESNCIPAGMELFPASDEEQFEFIKRVIDDCDYYLLILGGRYGSTNAEGTSYTELEFNYATSIGLRVIALVHHNPDEIALGKSEKDSVPRQRLEEFRRKVCTDRLVKEWTSADQLPGLVMHSLMHHIKVYPAIGWVRANKGSSIELLTEINELRKTNAKLESALGDSQPKIENLAGLDDQIQMSGQYRDTWQRGAPRYWSTKATWSAIFSWLAPYLVSYPTAEIVKLTLGHNAFKSSGRDGEYLSIDDQIFQTIGVQLQALGLVKVEYQLSTAGKMALFWSLTLRGQRMMIELRTIRKPVPGAQPESVG
jgi:Domain of unknown function (DUF4062)